MDRGTGRTAVVKLTAFAALAFAAPLWGCQRSSYYSAMGQDAASAGAGTQLASGIGSGVGYDGQVSRHIHRDPAHPCSTDGADGEPLPNSEIDIVGSGSGAVALLVRSSCADLVPPQALSLAEIQFAAGGSGDLTYQSLLYVPAPMTAFYVSPAGSDGNPGTQSAPFGSLAKVQSAMQGSSVIKTGYLRAGTYGLSAPLTLTASDNGETWQYYPPDGVDSAVLDGGGSIDLIHIDGGSNITIDGLKLQNFSAYGVMATGGPNGSPPGPVASGDTVENCDIGFNTANSWTSGGVYFWDAAPGTIIRNNYVHDLGSQGIAIDDYASASDSIDGSVISGNVVLRAVQRLSSGGAIYLGMHGGNQASHVAVTGNFIRDYGASGITDENGIDVDEYASNVTVTGNIVAPPVVAAGAAFVVWNGHDEHISGNIVDLGAAGTEWTASWYGDSTAIGGVAGNTFTGNVVIAGFAGSQDTPSTAGQTGYSYYENDGPGSNYTIQDNLYYNYGGGQMRTNGPLASDANPVLADPLASGWSYQLAAGSPAFSSPVSFPNIAGGWGPPGFAIPQSGTAPSSPH